MLGTTLSPLQHYDTPEYARLVHNEWVERFALAGTTKKVSKFSKFTKLF